MAVGSAGPVPIAAGAEDHSAMAARLVDGYREKLAELADWCDQRELADEALQTRDWLKPRDPARLFVPVLPAEVGPPPPPQGEAEAAAEWHKRFYRLRQEQAAAYYVLARKAVKASHASLAFDLIMEALRENPDHDAIRKLLGFRQYRGRWVTNYEIRRAQAGYVWHERFGWLKRNQVDQYEQGKRYHQGRWITAEEDARLHADIAAGWVVATEHYNILTNRGIEEAVRLGKKLEGLYRVWKQLFIGFYATERQLAGLFEGQAATIQLPQHNVVYFRDRRDYVATLRPISKNIEISLGSYIHGPTTVTKLPAVYFFAGDDSDEVTLFHEAVHQLFHESRKVSPLVGRACNFWIIEGAAMYFESLREENGYHVLGGFDTQRMLDARFRLLESRFYVPLATFCELNMTDMQSDPRIGMLYSQAAGLCHFLIHADGGRYRDALVGYLNAVYDGRDNVGTLSRLTGRPYAELDRQYAEYMAAGGK